MNFFLVGEKRKFSFFTLNLNRFQFYLFFYELFKLEVAGRKFKIPISISENCLNMWNKIRLKKLKFNYRTSYFEEKQKSRQEGLLLSILNAEYEELKKHPGE